MGDPRATSVLFICTGNSARSQMAEALMRILGGERFRVASAGTHPKAAVHPDALKTLARHQIEGRGLRPKDVATFKGQSFDYVIVLCDRDVESCPVQASIDVIHWRFADPSKVEDEEKRARAFEDVFQGLSTRIRLLTVVNERS